MRVDSTPQCADHEISVVKLMVSPKSPVTRGCRLVLVIVYAVLLSGCGVINFIHDRPLISEMGILQSRREYERRLQEYETTHPTPPPDTCPLTQP